MASCERCGASLKGLEYLGRRTRCPACAKTLADSRKPKVQPWQRNSLRQMAKVCTRSEMMVATGLSYITVYRVLRQEGLTRQVHRYPPKEVEAVRDHYAKHGIRGLQDAFPGVCCETVRNKTKLPSRQLRWSSRQLHVAAQMSGLVPMAVQAAVLQPGKKDSGAVRSMWRRKLGNTGTELHGMRLKWAYRICRRTVPSIEVFFAARGAPVTQRRALWCDMAEHLQPGLPDFLRDAVLALADFQRWLFASEDPRAIVLQIVQEANLHRAIPKVSYRGRTLRARKT